MFHKLYQFGSVSRLFYSNALLSILFSALKFQNISISDSPSHYSSFLEISWLRSHVYFSRFTLLRSQKNILLVLIFKKNLYFLIMTCPKDMYSNFFKRPLIDFVRFPSCRSSTFLLKFALKHFPVIINEIFSISPLYLSSDDWFEYGKIHMHTYVLWIFNL